MSLEWNCGQNDRGPQSVSRLTISILLQCPKWVHFKTSLPRQATFFSVGDKDGRSQDGSAQARGCRADASLSGRGLLQLPLSIAEVLARHTRGAHRAVVKFGSGVATRGLFPWDASNVVGDSSLRRLRSEFVNFPGRADTLIRAGRTARASSPAKEREKCFGALRAAWSASPAWLRERASPPARASARRGRLVRVLRFGITRTHKLSEIHGSIGPVNL